MKAEELVEKLAKKISSDVSLFDCQGDCPDEVAIYELKHYGTTIRTQDYCDRCFSKQLITIFKQFIQEVDIDNVDISAFPYFRDIILSQLDNIK
jgi:hypothetical protein